MGVYKERNGWRVKWREGGSQQSRRFKTEDEAVAFDKRLTGLEPQPEDARPEEVDVAKYVAQLSGVPEPTVAPFVRGGRVRFDGAIVGASAPRPQIVEVRWRERWIEETHTGSVAPDLAAQRERRTARQAAAEKAGVAIGYVDADANVLPGAPPIRKDMQRG